MKVGEYVPVTIAGQVIAQAVIKEIGNGTATLIVPATQVVMGVRTELDTGPVEQTPSKQVIIDGVDRVDANGEVIEAPAPVEAPKAEDVTASVEPAPVAEPQPEATEAPEVPAGGEQTE